MQPDTFQTKNAIQWEDLVTFRKRAETIARETGTLAQDINKDVYYSYEDRPEVGDATSRLRFTTGQVVAARKFHLKRTVKTRKLGSGTSSKKPAQKEEHDEYQGVVKYTESPSWLLEPDGDEVSPLLASPFHYELIKRTLQPIPSIISQFVSKAALSTNYGRSFASNIMASIAQHPAQLHAMMFALMVHDRVAQGISEPTPTELMIHTEAIRHLNEEISDPNPVRALSDSNIWTVLVMAYSGRRDEVRSGQSYPRQSFLRELQSAHVFLKMNIVIEHVLGLIKMVELLGGLRKIRTPGIAQTLSWAGVMGAVRNLTRPIFPFISHTTTFVQEDGRLHVTQHEKEAVANELGQQGTGFWQVWSTDASTPPYLDPLLEVIQDTCDFTVVVENHASGRWLPRTSHDIIDQRNFVQHKIMSLVPEDELIATDLVSLSDIDSQYESCRLACIIYSLLIVMPVPPVVGPFETLTEKLKSLLQAREWKVLNTRRLRLHLWILVMGAIASIGLPDRPWFLLRTMEVLEEFDMAKWKDLKALLKMFLWHPRTSDFDGLDIWKAVQHVQQVDTLELVK